MDTLRKIGKYEVLASILGDGGFCCVFPCQYNSATGSRTNVAVKISLVPVEDITHDMKVHLCALHCVQGVQANAHCVLPVQWTAHKREWQMYQIMAFGRTKDSQGSGIPAVYECMPQTANPRADWFPMPND